MNEQNEKTSLLTAMIICTEAPTNSVFKVGNKYMINDGTFAVTDMNNQIFSVSNIESISYLNKQFKDTKFDLSYEDMESMSMEHINKGRKNSKHKDVKDNTVEPNSKKKNEEIIELFNSTLLFKTGTRFVATKKRFNAMGIVYEFQGIFLNSDDSINISLFDLTLQETGIVSLNWFSKYHIKVI